MTVTIDSKQYNVTTNKDGYFAYKYLANKQGTYDITVSLVGDDEYADNECKTTLTVN